MKLVSNTRNVTKLIVLLAAIIAFASACLKQADRLPVAITSSEPPPALAIPASLKLFEKFSHKIKEHEKFECASCHRREGRSLDMEFAGHDSCVGCHLSQWTDPEMMEKGKIFCGICHTAAPPDMLEFPKKFKEGFNMKFDHGDHDSGAGRPGDGCASCHRPAGPGKTIPSGFQAHNNCYGCHTAESKIGSCSVCHALAPYNRTLPSEYNFRYIFRHGDHNSASCNECHKVSNGAPQGRQVSSIAIKQHFSSGNCAQCHNGRRAFSGNDPTNVASCSRCHKDFVAILPPGTVPDEPE